MVERRINTDVECALAMNSGLSVYIKSEHQRINDPRRQFNLM